MEIKILKNNVIKENSEVRKFWVEITDLVWNNLRNYSSLH